MRVYAVQCTILLDVKYRPAPPDSMSIESVPVSSVMTKDVKTADEGQTISAVAALMTGNNIGCVVIVKKDDRQTPVGIITERDIVKLVGLPQISFAAQAKEVMKKPVTTVGPITSLREAVQTMQAKNIRRLPVVEKGKMVGIVTDTDIFRAIIKNQALITSIVSENVFAEYKPVYEQLSEFMLSEMYLPGDH
jgi:CBS domain-containing protein